MGVGIPFFPPLTLSIDVASLAYDKIKKSSRKSSEDAWISRMEDLFEDETGNASVYMPEFFTGQNKVSVVITSHNQENMIEDSIREVYRQDYPLENVMVSDSNLDGTSEVVNSIESEFPNLHYWSKDGITSKAGKINAMVRDSEVDMGDYVYFIDCGLKMEPGVIKKMAAALSDDSLSAVTSYGYVTPPKSRLAGLFHYGKEWTNRMGKFRKEAQEKRRAMFVVCGSSYMVRSDVMKKSKIPEDTLTEDTAFTWELQKNGHKIGFVKDAVVYADDVPTISSQIKQSQRWYRGTWQNIATRKSIFGKKSDAKSLAYSTVLPGTVESCLYAGAVTSLPAVAAVAPEYFTAFVIGDTILSLAAPAIAPALSGEPSEIPKEIAYTLKHYPQILAYKAISSGLWLYTGLETGYDIITGKSKTSWGNTWDRKDFDLK